MSEDPRVLRPLSFEYINPKLAQPDFKLHKEETLVLKPLSFEYLTPEFARPDFKLPSEEDKEREWAIIGAIFQGYKLIDPEKVKAHMKGNEPMDEELFTKETIKRLTIPEGASPKNSEHYETLVVDIKTYTMQALKLQRAVILAEDALEDACQKQQEAATAVDDARAKLREHLDAVCETHVTLRKGPHE